jgi:hypothetical protein
MIKRNQVVLLTMFAAILATVALAIILSRSRQESRAVTPVLDAIQSRDISRIRQLGPAQLASVSAADRESVWSAVDSALRELIASDERQSQSDLAYAYLRLLADVSAISQSPTAPTVHGRVWLMYFMQSSDVPVDPKVAVLSSSLPVDSWQGPSALFASLAGHPSNRPFAGNMVLGLLGRGTSDGVMFRNLYAASLNPQSQARPLPQRYSLSEIHEHMKQSLDGHQAIVNFLARSQPASPP